MLNINEHNKLRIKYRLCRIEHLNLLFILSPPPALFKKFCKRDFCDEVRDFKIPEPEAVAS